MNESEVGMPIWIAICALVTALVFVIPFVRMLTRNVRKLDDTADAAYIATLNELSESSVRRHFDPFVDIDWNSPEHAITADDPRWVLKHGLLGCSSWYRGQPLEKQIAMGMWRQANIAKVALQFETMLIRGLTHYASLTPNGSPEHRYCMHESVEECNHVMMFQQLVDRIGADVPGMRWWMRRLAPVMPLYAGPFPNVFFFAVLAGEMPLDVIQTRALRDAGSVHPLVEKVMAIHVAEESRHISFAHAYLRRQVPRVQWANRMWMSLYVPVVMRVLATPILVPPPSFFRSFDVPRSLRKRLITGSPESRQAMQDMFADMRMLCTDIGLMNPVGRLMWRLCRIDGTPARYRGEPQRSQAPTQAIAA